MGSLESNLTCIAGFQCFQCDERETKTSGFPVDSTVADPDLELGGGGGVCCFTRSATFSSFCHVVFFTQNKGGGECPPLDPPLLGKNVRAGRFINSAQRIMIVFKGKGVEI